MIRKAYSPAPNAGRKPSSGPPQENHPQTARKRPDQPGQLRAISRQGARRLRRPARGPAGHGQPAVAAHPPGRPAAARTEVRPARRQGTFSDVGSGAGQIAKHLLKYADADASITCCDLSPEMLRRGRARLKSTAAAPTWRPTWCACPLPTAASTASPAATCWSTCPMLGLACRELARVMRPGRPDAAADHRGQFLGRWTSRFWCCRTYNRASSIAPARSWGWCGRKSSGSPACTSCCSAGGICVEIEKLGRPPSPVWLSTPADPRFARSTSFVISGGQLIRSGNRLAVPRLTCSRVGGSSKKPPAYLVPCQLGQTTGPITGRRICPPCVWPASIRSKPVGAGPSQTDRAYVPAKILQGSAPPRGADRASSGTWRNHGRSSPATMIWPSRSSAAATEIDEAGRLHGGAQSIDVVGPQVVIAEDEEFADARGAGPSISATQGMQGLVADVAGQGQHVDEACWSVARLLRSRRDRSGRSGAGRTSGRSTTRPTRAQGRHDRPRIRRRAAATAG